MINMIELFNYHQVTIDVASPEAGTIQKVIFMNYSNIKLVKSDHFCLICSQLSMDMCCCSDSPRLFYI